MQVHQSIDGVDKGSRDQDEGDAEGDANDGVKATAPIAKDVAQRDLPHGGQPPQEGEDAGDIIGSTALDTLEQTLLVKIQEIQRKMQLEEDSGELQKLDAVLSGLLQNLERTRKVKKT